MIAVGDLVRWRNSVIRHGGRRGRTKRGDRSPLRGKQDIMRVLRIFKEHGINIADLETSEGRKGGQLHDLVVHRKDPKWLEKKRKREERRRGRATTTRAVPTTFIPGQGLQPMEGRTYIVTAVQRPRTDHFIVEITSDVSRLAQDAPAMQIREVDVDLE